MPFSRKKPGRSLLQRLSDQRRSLVLAGLAAGAALGATLFRRSRRGVEAASRPPAEPGPPPVEEVPAPAREPAINGPAASDLPATAEPDAEAPSTSSEPATGELSAQEASVLAVLAQSGRGDDDRTAIAVATSLERDAGDVADVLRKLAGEGVVSGELYTAAGEKIWAVTERGVRRLGAQS